MKSEPNVYSIDQLKEDKFTPWEGVRNYQARNFMRDEMKKGDLVFFYHSNAEPSGIVGVAEVSREAYPDSFQFDKKSKYFDSKSQRDNPRWYLVDIQFKKKFKKVLSLGDLKQIKELDGMPLLQRGQRLSVQPVSETEWKRIIEESQK